ncbi:MAG: NfeD family protein [Betaproteobacteria bacterium]|nr:NfeD family protein [Betaproteobacteria bacterium]
MELVWWHWFVLGLALIALEILTPTFFLLWFGLGALLAGIAVWLWPMGLAAQVLLWSAASLAMMGVWLKYFKNPADTRPGQAKESVLGTTGLVTRAVGEMGQGEILFQRPVLGADRWPVIADAPIEAGKRARVVDVLGQILKVEQTGE